MDGTRKSIFEKCEKKKRYISKNKLLDSIPFDSYESGNNVLKKDHIEWRWRFYRINNKNIVEISRKNPGESRMFVDKDGDWCRTEIPNKWEKFMTNEKYYYVEPDEE
jgi:hypothetical protein